MPRPKRTKVASTTTSTRVATAAKPTAAPLKTIATRVVSQAASDSVTTASDDSDGLVTKKKGARIHKSINEDVYMTGAVQDAEEDTDNTRNKRSRRAVKKTVLDENQLRTLAALEKRRDDAKAAARSTKPTEDALPLKAASSTKVVPVASTPIRRSGRSPAARNVVASTAAETTTSTRAREHSDISLPSPSLGDLSVDSPQSIRRPQSALKVRGTPGVESSVLNLANFKRRPRQPSILRMVQQANNNNSDDDDGTELGLDDFEPEDESTPLQVKVTSAIHPSEDEGSSALSSNSKKRKRTSLAQVETARTHTSSSIQVPRSPQQADDLGLYDMPSSPPARPSSIARVRQSSPHESQSSSLPSRIEQTQPSPAPPTRAQTPEILSQTMAPPLSSSPAASPRSPAVTIPSPKSTRKKRASNRNKPILTETLQSLLPKRRSKVPRQIDEFDIHSSSSADQPLNSDDDELSRPNNRRKTNPTARTPLKTRGANARSLKSAVKTKKPAKSKPNTKAANTASKKTYSRRAADKENLTSHNAEEGESFALDAEEDNDDVPGVDDSTTTLTPAGSKRMEAMARKFAEVDEWEFVTESVDVGGESSSPWR